MSYLSEYGTKKRKFQVGGEMPAAPPAEGGGQEEQIIALAEAAVAGDEQAAMELGMLVAPIILEQVAGAGAGEAEAMAAEQEAPVFSSGGKFLRKI